MGVHSSHKKQKVKGGDSIRCFRGTPALGSDVQKKSWRDIRLSIDTTSCYTPVRKRDTTPVTPVIWKSVFIDSEASAEPPSNIFLDTMPAVPVCTQDPEIGTQMSAVPLRRCHNFSIPEAGVKSSGDGLCRTLSSDSDFDIYDFPDSFPSADTVLRDLSRINHLLTRLTKI